MYIVKNCYSKETVEQWSMYTLYKVRVKLMYTLYNDLTIFSKKWLKSGLLQFLIMWILWDRKFEYGFFHITHAKNSSNHSSSTLDLTRFFGICDVEKLTFPPYSILSLLWYSLETKIKRNLLYSLALYHRTHNNDHYREFWTINWSFGEIPASIWQVF